VSLFDGDAVHFFQAGDAVPDLLQARPAQVPDAVLGRLIADIHGPAAFHDHTADGLGDRRDLKDAHAALVAVRALAAADRLVDPDAARDVRLLEAFLAQRLGRNIEGLLAVAAELARQALRDDETHRGGDGVGLDPHIDQAGQG